MNTHLATPTPGSGGVPAGYAWERLHTEREEVCAALLANPRYLYGMITSLVESELAEGMAWEIEFKRRELLQARLRQIDDALDRVISGFYGQCGDCGKPLDERRLAANPAAATCLKC